MHIHSYPSIFNLGHKAISSIFEDDVEITAKIDGSQFSFSKINGELSARSKGKDLDFKNPEKMFSKALDVVETLDLKDGYIYRAEYLQSEKHNSLKYSRIPKKHLIIYNIEKGNQDFLTYEEMVEESKRIGLEVVPLIFRGKIESIDQLRTLLDREAYLGGCKEEGFVIKNYYKFGPDKKILMAKLVTQEFKEVHSKERKGSNPAPIDIIQEIIFRHKTNPRIDKAIIHLKERGELTESLKDIGNIIKEYTLDVEKEEEQSIKDELWRYFWPKIRRAITCHIPEYYKNKLTETQKI